MNQTETATLLTLIAAFDRRTIGESDVLAWHDLLGDVDAADAATAVKAHFASSRDYLMPVDVIDGVKAIRLNRLRRVQMPEPPQHISNNPDPQAYRDWYARTIDDITSGRYTGDTDPAELKARDVRSAIEGAFKQVSPRDSRMHEV